MAIYRDQGVVLRTMRYREADRIVTLLTRAHGKFRAIIKGTRKTKSRFGARVEPFSHVDVMIYHGRSDLRVVSQADLVDAFAHIRTDYDAYMCAQVMCEAIDKVAPDEEENVRLMMLLLAGLRAVDDCVRLNASVPHIMQSAFLLKMLGVAGFGPSLRVCVHCGGVDGLTAFSLAEGGVICSACAGSQDVVVDPATVAVLRMLWSTPMADIAGVTRVAAESADDPGLASPPGVSETSLANAPGEVDGLMRRVVEYHLERRLRSLELRPA